MGHPHLKPTEEALYKQLPYLRDLILIGDLVNPEGVDNGFLFLLLLEYCEATGFTPYWRGSVLRGTHRVSIRYGTEIIHIKRLTFKEAVIEAIRLSFYRFIQGKRDHRRSGSRLLEVL